MWGPRRSPGPRAAARREGRGTATTFEDKARRGSSGRKAPGCVRAEGDHPETFAPRPGGPDRGPAGPESSCRLSDAMLKRGAHLVGDALDVAIADLLVPDLKGLAANAVQDGQESRLEGVLEHLSPPPGPLRARAVARPALERGPAAKASWGDGNQALASPREEQRVRAGRFVIKASKASPRGTPASPAPTGGASASPHMRAGVRGAAPPPRRRSSLARTL